MAPDSRAMDSRVMDSRVMDIRAMESYLLRSMEEFDSNPLAIQLMRRLAYEDPDTFFAAALKHLTSVEQSNAHRMLTVLLMRSDRLMRKDRLMAKITSPAAATRHAAINMFRRFLAVDPSFDVRLARELPGRTSWNERESLDTIRSTRALDILDETSRGRRLLPIMGHLSESVNPRIAAKATLFVGRRLQNPAWAAKSLTKPDQRVRANAVESLWGIRTGPALQMLENCVGDRNNRVTGNALMGLHLAGHRDAATEALSLSRAGKPDLRATSAWVMGKIGAPPFVDRLTELVRDESPQVRSMALRALLDVRRTETTAATSHEETPVTPTEVVVEAQKVLETVSSRSEISLRLDGSDYKIRKR